MASTKRKAQEKDTDDSVYVPTRYEARFDVEGQDEHTDRAEAVTEESGGETE